MWDMGWKEWQVPKDMRSIFALDANFALPWGVCVGAVEIVRHVHSRGFRSRRLACTLLGGPDKLENLAGNRPMGVRRKLVSTVNMMYDGDGCLRLTARAVGRFACRGSFV